MTALDRDLGQIHGFTFGYSRHDHDGLEPWTVIDFHFAGRGQQIDVDSHHLTMRLPRGREVEILMLLRNQIHDALAEAYSEQIKEADARLAALSIDSIEKDSPLTEPLS